jgi:hypothetical protein
MTVDEATAATAFPHLDLDGDGSMVAEIAAQGLVVP